jgi:hypothetical protein
MPDQDTEPKVTSARRRGGFSMPKNPAQALQDMIRQERTPDSPPPSEESGSIEPSTESLSTSSVVAHTTASPKTLPAASLSPTPEPSDALAQETTLPVVDTTSSIVGITTTDPIRVAVLQMLRQPLPMDAGKGPQIVTSIKVHQGIWERLGHVAQITGRNKQDLVAEALTDLFAKILREEEQGRG